MIPRAGFEANMSWLDSWPSEYLLPLYGHPGFDEHTEAFRGRFTNFVRRTIERVTFGRNVADTDDIENEVWAKLLVAKHLFIPGEAGSAVSWLRTVVERVARDCGRKDRQARQSDEGQLEELANGEPAADLLAANKENIELVFNAIAKLPPENQAILALAQPHGESPGIGLGLLTLKEVSDLLGCSGPAAVCRNRQASYDSLCKTLKVDTETEDDK